MENFVKISMRYCGKDVDDGTMSLEDTIYALQGFSSAYGKILKSKSIEAQHELRLIEIKKGSSEFIIKAQELISSGVIPVIVGLSISNIFDILNTIKSVVELTKHTKNNEYKTKVEGDNNFVVVLNMDGGEMSVTYKIFELFSQKLIANDIKKIAAPLEQGKIDSGAILATKEDGSEFKTVITYIDKPYFDIIEREITSTKETWLDGILNSLTKTTNNGRFILSSGKQVPYSLVMENPETYYDKFAFRGSVKVKCIAYLDESLEVTKIDVYDIKEIQTNLFKNPNKENKNE